MKAIRIHAHGTEDQLVIDSISKPKPRADEILIRVKAAALNHLDLWVRKGIPGVPLPMIMGSDAAGVVEDMGDLAARDYSFKAGDEVLTVPIRSCGHCSFCVSGQENLCSRFHIPGESAQGTQAEWIAVPAKYVLRKPQTLSWAEAAALPLAAMTAYHMLFKKAQLRHGQRVLVYGASSGVGSMAVQMARAAGAEVFTTAGSDEKARLAEQLGAHHIIRYKKEKIAAVVKEQTAGAGVDVVFEHTGEKTWADSLRALRKGGTLVTCGATTGPMVQIDLRALFIKHQRLIGSTMGTVRDVLDVLRMVEQGQVKPVLDREYPFTSVREAHLYLEQEHGFGKVVLNFS